VGMVIGSTRVWEAILGSGDGEWEGLWEGVRGYVWEW
jgi:hypothetical protein